MNKQKIKELAKRAGYSEDFLDIGLPNNMEKFAELIIHRCIDAVISVPLPNDAEQRCAESVRKHFGIK